MFTIQAFVIGAVLILYSLLLVLSFRAFTKRISFVFVLIAPLAVYSVGFGMRLLGDTKAIDLGFFLTDFSVVFIYTLFTASLFLGQLKYWRK